MILAQSRIQLPKPKSTYPIPVALAQPVATITALIECFCLGSWRKTLNDLLFRDSGIKITKLYEQQVFYS